MCGACARTRVRACASRPRFSARGSLCTSRPRARDDALDREELQVKARKPKATKKEAVISIPSAPPRCARCGKIKANHFFKTRHCAPHRDDVYEVAK